VHCLLCFIVNFVTYAQHHPDLNPGDPSSHTKFVRLNEAYSVLSDVTSRREYDLRSVRSIRARQHSQSHNQDSHFSQRSASHRASHYRLKACSLYTTNITFLIVLLSGFQVYFLWLALWFAFSCIRNLWNLSWQIETFYVPLDTILSKPSLP